MTWQESKAIGDQWVNEHLGPDLSGQVLQLVTFEHDRDCRFFYGDRSAKDHAQITKAIARQARKRKGKTVQATITPERYNEWLQVQGQEDSPERRAEFIASCHYLSPAE